MPGRVPEPSTTAGSVVSSTAFPSNWIACANASLAIAESTDLHHPIHSVIRNTVKKDQRCDISLKKVTKTGLKVNRKPV